MRRRTTACGWIVLAIAVCAGDVPRVGAQCAASDVAIGAVSWADGSIDAAELAPRVGGAWTAWREASPDSSALWVCALGEDGAPAGPPQRVAVAASPGSVEAPCLTSLGHTTWIVYESVSGSESRLWLRRLDDTTGTPAAQDLGAAATFLRIRLPRAACVPSTALHPARIAIVWTDWSGAAPSLAGVWCDSLGVPLSEPWTWRSSGEGCTMPALAPWGADSVVVTWLEGSWPTRVCAGFADIAGDALECFFECSGGGAPARRAFPRVAAADGALACVWTEGVEGVSRAVMRWGDATGPRGDPLALDGATLSHELAPSVAIAGARALCAWESGESDATEVRGRWVARDGSGDADDDAVIVLSAGAPRWRRRPVVAALGAGPILAEWSERADSLESFAVAGRIECAPGATHATADGVGLHGERGSTVRCTWRAGRRIALYTGAAPAWLRAVDARGRSLGPPVLVRPMPGGAAVPFDALGVPPRRAAFVHVVRVARADATEVP